MHDQHRKVLKSPESVIIESMGMSDQSETKF